MHIVFEMKLKCLWNDHYYIIHFIVCQCQVNTEHVHLKLKLSCKTTHQSTCIDDFCLPVLSCSLASVHPAYKSLHSSCHPSLLGQVNVTTTSSDVKLATITVLTTCRSDTAASRRVTVFFCSLHASPPHRYSQSSVQPTFPQSCSVNYFFFFPPKACVGTGVCTHTYTPTHKLSSLADK